MNPIESKSIGFVGDYIIGRSSLHTGGQQMPDVPISDRNRMAKAHFCWRHSKNRFLGQTR
jgi:hypothetical protein